MSLKRRAGGAWGERGQCQGRDARISLWALPGQPLPLADSPSLLGTTIPDCLWNAFGEKSFATYISYRRAMLPFDLVTRTQNFLPPGKTCCLQLSILNIEWWEIQAISSCLLFWLHKITFLGKLVLPSCSLERETPFWWVTDHCQGLANPVSGLRLFRKSSQIYPQAGLFTISSTLSPPSSYILPCLREASLAPHPLDFCQQGSGVDSAKQRGWCGVLKAEQTYLFSAAAVGEQASVDDVGCCQWLPSTRPPENYPLQHYFTSWMSVSSCQCPYWCTLTHPTVV